MLVVCESIVYIVYLLFVFFFQAEDGIRDLVRSRGLGDVYKRQPQAVRRPLLMMPTRSHSFSATSMMCVEKKSVPPLSLIHI